MSIRSNIEAVMQAIQGGDVLLGETLRIKAVGAIKSGEGSPEWVEYMQHFAQTPEELARLTPTDDTKDDFDMDVARTYLLGNSTCGAETTGFHLIEGVDDKLDEGLGG
jgi:hypothetical protein